jgi:Holliday junction resolvase RusA-like endonuclease
VTELAVSTLDLPVIAFHVAGVPRPQGSPFLARGRALNSSQLRVWRDLVHVEALRIALTLPRPLSQALALDVEFRFPFPQRTPKALVACGMLPRSRRPDLDKLVRAVGDSLVSAKLITDDAQIVDLRARKFDVDERQLRGAIVRLWPAQLAMGLDS